MRDLTEDEVREYFRFTKADLKAGDFHREQVVLIGGVVKETGFIDAAIRKMLKGIFLDGMPEDEVLLSFWVSGFQMGRECESRLLTHALKATVKGGPER
jgi:hypothetical protein